MQPQSIDRAELMRTIQRCAEAYHRIRAELPEKVFYHDNLENQQKASLASLAELPVLIDPKSFQLYIACIAQGVGFGAVDVVDAGRLSHLATSAMSAWKLANLTAPAAERKERESAEKEQKQPTPLPPKGNHHGAEDGQSQAQTARRGPETGPRAPQKRRHPPSKGNHPGADDGQSQPRQTVEGQNQATQDPKTATSLPSKGNHPDGEALPCVDLARWYQKAQQTSPAGAKQPPHPQPAKEQPSAHQQQPTQAAWPPRVPAWRGWSRCLYSASPKRRKRNW